MKNGKNIFIISLGGSLIVPRRINWRFLKKFRELILKQIKKGKKFIIITGGGYAAREYQNDACKVTELTKNDRDWLGIHATRMNAHLVRTIFRKFAHPVINTNPHDVEDFYNFKGSVMVAAGWRPGFSTDYDAVVLGRYFGVKKIMNLSNIDYVYDKDPNKYANSKKIRNISWTDFRKIVGNKWDPGLNAPFDPIASKIAQEAEMEVAIMNGKKLKNVERYFDGKGFTGTVIK